MTITPSSEFLTSYLATALWSSTGDDEEPLDNGYTVEDVGFLSLNRAARDCAAFLTDCNHILRAAGYDVEDTDIGSAVAHDLWLTRNGHGCGFWDGDYPEPQASQLTAYCQQMGECHLVEDGEGSLIIENG